MGRCEDLLVKMGKGTGPEQNAAPAAPAQGTGASVGTSKNYGRAERILESMTKPYVSYTDYGTQLLDRVNETGTKAEKLVNILNSAPAAMASRDREIRKTEAEADSIFKSGAWKTNPLVSDMLMEVYNRRSYSVAKIGMMQMAFGKLQEDVNKAVQENRAAIEDYNGFYGLTQENPTADQFRVGSGAAWDAWRGSIRKAEDIKPELEKAQEEAVKAGQLAQAAKSDVMMAEGMVTAHGENSGLEERQRAYSKAQAEAEEMMRKVNLLQEELDYSEYLEWEELRGNQDFAEKSVYVPTGEVETYTTHPTAVPDTGFVIPQRTGYRNNGVDLNYEYINGNKAAEPVKQSENSEPGEYLLGDGDYLRYMTEDEKSLYNYVHATQGKERADKYLEYLKTKLTARLREEYETNRREYADAHPRMASFETILTAPARGISYIGQGLDYLKDGKIDQNAAYNRFSYGSSAIRDEVAKKIEESGKWGKAGSFLYQTGMSMGDFLMTAAVSGGNEALSLAIMGSGAAADTVIEAKDNGLSDRQAFALGTIAGAAEIVTERVSLEKLLDKAAMGRSAVGYFLQNILAEGSEEAASDIINWTADVLIAQDKSQWKKAIESYKAQGMSENAAFISAMKDKAAEIGLDALGGALSGGVMAVPGTVGAGINNNRAGSSVNWWDETTVRGLIDEARNLGDSPAYKAADALEKKINAGREITRADVGGLINLTQQARAEKAGGAAEADNAAASGETEEKKAPALQKKGPEETKEGIPDKLREALKEAGVNEDDIANNGEPEEMTLAERRFELSYREQTLRRRISQFMEAQSRGEDTGSLQDELMKEADAIEQERRDIEQAEAAEQRKAEDEDSRAKIAELTVAPTGTQIEERRERVANLRELERSGRESGATEEQIETARRISDATGRRVVFINEGKNGRRGSYTSGTIYVNAAYGDEAGQIISHELTHSIEESEEYQAFSSLVQRRIMETGGDLDEMLREVRERYAAAGIELDSKRGDDMREVVAEYVERELLTNEESITSLVRENRSLGRRILDLLNKLLAKLGVRSSKEKDFLRSARDLYARALVDTRRETASRAALEEALRALAAGEITDEEFDGIFDALGIETVEEEGKIKHSVSASDRRERAGALRQMLNSGASAQDIRQYVNGLADKGTQQSPAGTKTGGARQIIDAAHRANMSVDEYLRQNWDEYEVDGELRPEDRRALELEGGRQYSIAKIEGEKGDYGQGVVLDTNLFDGVSPRNWGKVLGKFVYEHLAGKNVTIYDEEGNAETVHFAREKDRVTKTGANNSHRVIDKLARYKGDNIRTLATVHLSEALRTSTFENSTDDHTHQWMDQNGWEYRKAILQDKKGDIYEATLNIARGRDRNILYDVNNIRKIDTKNGTADGVVPSAQNGRGSLINHGSDKKITQKGGNVKTQFSVAREETDSTGRKTLRVHTDAYGNVVLPENMSYRIAGEDSPMSDYGHAMFADDPSSYIAAEVNLLRGSRGIYAVRHDLLTDINDLKKEIARRWDEDRDDAFDNAPMITDEYLEGVTGEEIAEEFDPKDIVDSAAAYDNYELTQWFYDKVIEPGEIAGVKTSDGAVVFDDSAIQRVELEGNRRKGDPDVQYSVAGGDQDIRDTIPAKARAELDRTERSLVNKAGTLLNVPQLARRKYLADIAAEISREYLTSGKISEETTDRLFETAYSQGIEVNREFYDQYKDLKKRLRETPVFISEKDQANVLGYDNFASFRRAAFGTLRIVNDGGTPVDMAYGELSSAYPKLFPEDITDPGAQILRMYEVGNSIRISEKSLDEAYGKDAEDFRKWAKNDFGAAVGDMVARLRTVKRYVEDRAARGKTEGAALTLEEVKELYPKARDARKNYEKVNAKNLLTAEDQRQVGRLLRGDIELSDLSPERDNVRGITEVYRAKAEYEQYARQIREWNNARKESLRQEADEYLKTANGWKDKRVGILYSRETMERNIRDIVPDAKLADRIVKAYFTPVHEAAARSTKLKNRMRERVRALNLSRKAAEGNTVSEAHAAQLLGEAMDNIDYLTHARTVKQRDGKSLSDWRGVVQDLYASNPNMNWDKIKGAVDEFRKIYDELFELMNDSRVRNGYEPVAYRKGYFPHFQPGEGDGLISQFGKALGISTEVTALPTTINGLTHTFRPGIQWFGNALERTGFNTAYDAVEGFDKYIEGVADVIYQTENIQKLRALASQTRYRTSDAGLRDQVDEIRADTTLLEQDKENRIKALYESGRYTLSNFVVELEEYTNLLANKKSRADRNMEQALGRNMYNLVKTLEGRVAANMVAINPGSWLTNFIPLTQGWSMLSSRDLLRGMGATLKAYKADDGFVGMSAFLTNRRGSDPLVRTWQQKASATMSKPMEWIDNFTADSLVRARYQQNLSREMSEAAAMEEADSWVAGVMADRSKGSTPTLFNRHNPLTKLFTQFQLEVNNQLSYVCKDMPQGLKNKGLGALALALFKFALGAWLYDEVYEYFIGRRPALDPIGLLNDTVGDLTGYEVPNLVSLGVGAVFGNMPSFKTGRTGIGTAGKNLAESVAEEMPFVGGLLGGGRLPISSAIPDVQNLWGAATNSGQSGRKRWNTAVKEIGKPLTYLLLPFGGGQMKKILEGVSAVVKGGSYTVDSKGRDIMQYPIYNDSALGTAGNVLRASLFGKSSFPGAQRWVDSEFKNYSAKATGAYQGLLEAGIRGRDADDLIIALTGAEKTEDKSVKEVQIELLRKSTVPEDIKLIPYYALMANDSEIALIDALGGNGAAGELLDMLMDYDEAGTLKEGKLDAQRKAVFDSKLTDNEKIKAIGILESSTSYTSFKMSTAQKYGISMKDYYAGIYGAVDINGDGKVTQEDEIAAIDRLNLSREKKAVLYQLADSGWTPKNNPFDPDVGKTVYDTVQAEKKRREEGETEPEDEKTSGARWEHGRLVLPKIGESRVLPRG